MLTKSFSSISTVMKSVNLQPSTNLQSHARWVRKKSHTCEEGGTHLKKYFWAFTDKLEKQTFIKRLLKSAKKNTIAFIFTMLHFFKKK